MDLIRQILWHFLGGARKSRRFIVSAFKNEQYVPSVDQLCRQQVAEGRSTTDRATLAACCD
jgi:hypothetical protein